MRPRREVADDPMGYAVDGFVTRDQALAQAVAAELDRVDPLPCTSAHDDHAEWVDISDLGGRFRRRIFNCCGKRESY